jgi:hypothetical protein
VLGLFVFLFGTENDEGRLEDGNDKRDAGQYNRVVLSFFCPDESFMA